MFDDIIQVSHGFEGCQMLEYIAETCNSSLETGIEDITSYFGPSFLPIRWSNLKF
jgi:hypothetical protein